MLFNISMVGVQEFNFNALNCACIYTQCRIEAPRPKVTKLSHTAI